MRLSFTVQELASLVVSLKGTPSYATSGSNKWRSTSTVALAAVAVTGSSDVVSSVTAKVHCVGAADAAAALAAGAAASTVSAAAYARKIFFPLQIPIIAAAPMFRDPRGYSSIEFSQA